MKRFALALLLALIIAAPSSASAMGSTTWYGALWNDDEVSSGAGIYGAKCVIRVSNPSNSAAHLTIKYKKWPQGTDYGTYNKTEIPAHGCLEWSPRDDINSGISQVGLMGNYIIESDVAVTVTSEHSYYASVAMLGSNGNTVFEPGDLICTEVTKPQTTTSTFLNMEHFVQFSSTVMETEINLFNPDQENTAYYDITFYYKNPDESAHEPVTISGSIPPGASDVLFPLYMPTPIIGKGMYEIRATDGPNHDKAVIQILGFDEQFKYIGGEQFRAMIIEAHPLNKD